MSRFLCLALAASLAPLQAAPRPTGTFTLEVGGQRLHCQRSGKGPDLLLLHGGLSSSEDWDAMRPELEKRFSVLTYDRSGHGRSTDAGQPFAYAAMAEEAKGVLDALGIGKVAVAGRSDGGVVGYHLASRWPERVTHLMAIGANVSVDGPAPETLAWLKQRTTAQQLEADLPGAVATYRRLAPDPSRLASFLERSRELWLRDPYLPFEDLQRIQARVLLVTGLRGDVPQEHLLRIRSALKRAEPLCLLPGTSHQTLKEKPEDVRRLLQSWIQATR